MRIVHIITMLDRGGSEENTIITCLDQIAAGHDVTLVHGSQLSPDLRREVSRRIDLIEVKPLVRAVAPAKDFAAFIELRRVIRRIRPDVVHTHASKAGILGRAAAWSARVPAIIHGVHILPFVNVSRVKKVVYLALERFSALFTDAFIDVSEGMKEICLAHGIGSTEKHFVVHSGFDVERFRTAAPPSDWRDVLGIAPDAPKPPTVLMIASFMKRKRHAELLQEFVRAVKRYPDIRLLLCGEGEQRNQIAALSEELQITNNVRVLGFRPDPEKIIALADVCLLCSEREGLPRVVMQYVAGGRASVVCDLPGLKEILRDGVNGVVAPHNGVDILVDKTIALLSDAATLSKLADAARATDLGGWEQGQMWPKIERAYLGTLQQRKKAGGRRSLFGTRDDAAYLLATEDASSKRS